MRDTKKEREWDKIYTKSPVNSLFTWTTLYTPSGTPASARTSPKVTAVSELWWFVHKCIPTGQSWSNLRRTNMFWIIYLWLRLGINISGLNPSILSIAEIKTDKTTANAIILEILPIMKNREWHYEEKQLNAETQKN